MAVTREHLLEYLDEELSDVDAAAVEQALRASEPLRELLKAVMQDRDRGEHSLGAIWRRNRLTCPTREQLGSYVLEVLEPNEQDYVSFHLKTIACPYCSANLTDLQKRSQEAEPEAAKRRKKYFDSSAGYLHGRPRK